MSGKRACRVPRSEMPDAAPCRAAANEKGE